MGHLKRINSKRRRLSWKKHFGSQEYRAMVIAMDCLVPGCSQRPVDPHHYPTVGAGGTYRDLTPLCGGGSGHHREFHDDGQETFQKKHGLDLKESAKEIAKAGRHLVEGA